MRRYFSIKIALGILVFVPALLFPGKGISQKSDFSFPDFQNLSTKNGLSFNQGYVMMQDSRGFIWIATNYGLNRFDGYNFKVYNYDPAETNSLAPSWYFSLLEDKRGIIWLSSTTQGFFSFDPVTEKFERYYHQPDNDNSLSGDIDYANMVMDSSGIFWICTMNGLNSFDPVTKKFNHYLHRENDSTSISSNRIYWVCTDEENNIWAVTSANKADVFSISERKVIARYSIGTPEMPGNKDKPDMYVVERGKNGNIWIGSNDNGLYGYNTRSRKWKHYSAEQGHFSPNDRSVNIIHEDDSGNLLIAFTYGGLYHYNAASSKFRYSDVVSNRSESITYILRDRSGKTWMVGWRSGVYSFDPQLKNIVVVGKSQDAKSPVREEGMIGFYRSRENELFINAEHGVYLYDKERKSIREFKLIENGRNILDKNWIWQIQQDNNDVFWFCTGDGLISYDPRKKKHHFYKPIGNLKNPGVEFATGIAFDNSGKYWVSTFGSGLNLFDQETGAFKAYKVHRGKNSISSNHLGGIMKDSKGMLYIGTWHGGLVQFNPENETFKTFLHRPGDPASISSDITWPLYEDKHGFIWVGTVGGGLNAFDPATGRFKSYTMKDGLPSNAVVSLVMDDDGYTWLGTYHGISRCRLPDNPFESNNKVSFRNYDMSDGLPFNDMFFFGAHKEADGSLFFASLNSGVFYFHPHQWKDNEFIPPIHITSFSLLNKEVSQKDSGSVLKSAIEFTKEIILTYKQNMISFTFAALNYIHPEKNQYAYMLEGYDQDWIYTDASRRFATYTNLDPGEYIFKVKGSNNDGLWNPHPAELRISITPPFWKTAWFKILVIFSMFGAAWAFYRYRIGQILLLQRIRNKIAADLHDDIGSTLNSISVFSEVAKKDASRRDHALAMIGESSRKIIDSLSDIVWSINPQNDSFDKIIFRMRSITHNLLKAKNIDFTFRVDDSLNEIKLPMETRRNLYLIFKEALNNLVKYSHATRASVLVSHGDKCVNFIIRDNGVGFDSSQEYGGNGLSNMKKRATEIGALLLIESASGKGTSIELNLKL